MQRARLSVKRPHPLGEVPDRSRSRTGEGDGMSRAGAGRPSAMDSAVLEFVRRRTETTRVEVARELGVTAATVTNSVKRLLSAGLLRESGYARIHRRQARLPAASRRLRPAGVRLHDRRGPALAGRRRPHRRAALPIAVPARRSRRAVGGGQGAARGPDDHPAGGPTTRGRPGSAPCRALHAWWPTQLQRELTVALEVRAVRGTTGLRGAGQLLERGAAGSGLCATLHLDSSSPWRCCRTASPSGPSSAGP